MRPARRKGYTVFEILIVMALLILLGAVIVPTMSSYYGNTRQKAVADLIRARIVEGRAKAMEQGTWYRVAINQDKSRIRVAPDAGVNGQDFASLTPGNSNAPGTTVVEDKFENATAELIIDPTDTTRTTPDGEWITVMTIGPEGICKESDTVISVKELDYQPIQIRIRGIAASAAIVGLPTNGSKK
jgi:Tfp pilus assembly protein FimT